MAARGSDTRLRPSLRVSILGLFTLLVALLVTALVVVSYQRNRDGMQAMVEALIGKVAESVIVETRDFMIPARRAAEVAAVVIDPLAVKPARKGLGHGGRDFARILVGVLHGNDHISGTYLGFADGSAFQVLRVPEQRTGVWGELDLSPETRFLLWLYDPAGSRHRWWYALSDSGTVLGGGIASQRDYDPRVRPWYEAALAARHGHLVVSPVYTFATSGQKGVTLSRAIRRHGRVIAVAAADVTTAALSAFLTGHVVGPGGRTAIVADDGQLVADSGGPAPTETVLQASLAWHRDHGQDHAFVGPTGYYIAGQREFPDDVAPWTVVVISPLGYFIGTLVETNEITALISLALLVPALVLVAMVARMIAAPITRLTAETRRIRDFDLSEPVTVDSRIREVHDLAQGLSTMKVALEAFGRYVPRALVRRLITTGTGVELGGERRCLTLMFTDIAGFTTIAETQEPEALMRHLSSYFEGLGAVVLAEGGTIDKYIGDSIMALWGAPEPDPDQAVHACAAVLACRARLADLNRTWTAEGLPALPTRFGLHMGETVVGNIGCSDRMDYTALGDTVNLASRLEGLNKVYGTTILVSGAVCTAAGDGFVFRPVDRVAVKGRTAGVMVFELVDAAAHLGDADRALVAATEAAWRAWGARDWATVIRVAADWPHDGVLARLGERAGHFAQGDPGPDWDGIWRAPSK